MSNVESQQFASERIRLAASAAIGHAASETIRYGPVTVDYLRHHPTVSVGQSADLLGVSKAYAYEMVKDGRLDVIALGPRRVRVKSAALLRMLGIED